VIVDFFQAVFAFILVLAPLVFIHEFGHFIVAKYFGIAVPVFSIGFGPRLFGFKRRETDYRVSLIPLGGYVRMAGDEADENRTGGPEEFLSRPKYQRFFVFVAGATFNIILAFLALWMFFGIYGKEDVADRYPQVILMTEDSPAEQSGFMLDDKIITIAGQDVKKAQDFLEVYTQQVRLAPNAEVPVVLERDGQRIDTLLKTGEDPQLRQGAPGWLLTWAARPMIGTVVEGGAAEAAGIEVGDRILAARGTAPMPDGGHDKDPVTETELRAILEANPDQSVRLQVERGEQVLELELVPKPEGKVGKIGVQFLPAETVHRSLSLTEAAAESWRANIYLSKTLFVVLKRLVTGGLSLRTMSGPIGIAQVSKQALTSGPRDFLYLLGFFSLQLGILNLLPIPVLDGGHILILLIEGVARRDLSDRIKERVMQVGFVFLLAFMGVIIYLDIMKTWGT
jgi:regulator of sigma E protease